MYLRKTKRKNRDGSEVEYYQLAHNERHPVTRKPGRFTWRSSPGIMPAVPEAMDWRHR